MTNKKAVRQLFRALLRLGLRFDRNPAAKLLFYRKSTPAAQDVLAHQQQETRASASYYSNALVPMLFKQEDQLEEQHDVAKLFHPRNQGTVNLYKLVRREFRKPCDSVLETDRIDAAFIAVRKLSSLWTSFLAMNVVGGSKDKMPQQKGSPHDVCALLPKTDNAQGTAIDITETSSLLPGIIIVAHPMVQGPLKRAVILVLEHNTEGSYGVVLNKPVAGHSLDTAVANLSTQILSCFGKQKVFFGGMMRRLNFLHRFPSVAGSPIPLCRQPFFAGGNITDAIKIVGDNPSLVRNFHFFVGCCTWDANELEREFATGYWLPVHTHADEIVNLSTNNGGNNALPGQAADVDLWRYLVSRMGNNYKTSLLLPSWIDAGAVESL